MTIDQNMRPSAVVIDEAALLTALGSEEYCCAGLLDQEASFSIA